MILTQCQAAAVAKAVGELSEVEGSVVRVEFPRLNGRAVVSHNPTTFAHVYVRQHGAGQAVKEEWHKDLARFREHYKV